MMSTASPSLSFAQIKGDLNQIGHHLLQSETPLFPDMPPTAEQRALTRLSTVIKQYRRRYLAKARAHWPALSAADLKGTEGHARLAALADALNGRLLDMDATESVANQSLKTFMTYEAGFGALEDEARQGVADQRLHPGESRMLEQARLPPALRPGLYALTFLYQERRVELAGAFVATQKNTPAVDSLTGTQDVGQVLLFTPQRGIESFDTLPALNDWLREHLNDGPAGPEFRALLPIRYQTLGVAGIWPLVLTPITDKPLFEHTFDAQIDKRRQDIEYALSLADHAQQDPEQVTAALERAVSDALPDLDARLALHAQTLLERQLRHSAPDWYRVAEAAQRAALAEHLARYDRARRSLSERLGPAASALALARYQWLERLSGDLDIHDLAPERLSVTTVRHVAGVGDYTQTRNLSELALAGLHTDDEQPGSDFLGRTTLTYDDAALSPSHLPVTPAWLAQQLATLQPRIDYVAEQGELARRPDILAALETLFDTRINALAYIALMRGHLQADDWQRLQTLRNDSDRYLSAGLITVHGMPLQDLWVLRQTDAAGAVTRLLVCSPDAPQEHQFQAFDSETACQKHLLGWTLMQGTAESTGNRVDYLLGRVALRFRPILKALLDGLSHKPQDQAHLRFGFRFAASHVACLKSMAEHELSVRTDDCHFHTPVWYRSASAGDRRQLLTLAENAEGALRSYRRHPSSENKVPDFTAYLHQQARESLNRLLGRARNDIDPDSVWAIAPPPLFSRPEAPLNYTRLYRDGYADGIGFLDEKFSRTATFKGPPGVDLSRLSAEAVARSVTGVWVGQRYIDKVRAELLDRSHADYAFRRDATLAISQRQMLGAALESRLQGHIASADLHWLQACIRSLGDTSPPVRHRYAVHRLMIDGDWVMGALLFSHAGHPTLLYMPDAVDGIRFREARLFNFLLKSQPALVNHFTDRVDVRSRPRVREFLQNAVRQLPESLDSTAVSPPRHDPINREPPLSDLRFALYDMKLQRKIDEVGATTVNRTQMITDLVWMCVEWVTAIVTAPFPIASFSAGMALAFKDAMLALHAYHQRDGQAALGHLAGYLFNSAGAILTDLRPSLRTLRPVGKLLRASAAGTGHRQAMKLIRRLEPDPLAVKDMQPVLFNGENLWAPQTPDAIGRYLLYRYDPASGQLVSTTRLAAPNAEGVWKRTGIVGGAPEPKRLPDAPAPLIGYEMPASQWRDLEPLLAPDFKAKIAQSAKDLDLSPVITLTAAAKELDSLRAAYRLKVEQLSRDAQRHYRPLSPKPPRVPARPLAERTSFAHWLAGDDLTGGTPLIVGADPGSMAAKLALIEHLDTLIEKGFKRLYLEYLPTDIFRLKLEKMNAGESWAHIAKHLKTVDNALGLNEHEQHGYLALVRKAREKGMQIMGLDASTSYRLDDIMRMDDAAPTQPRTNDLRNFYSHKRIEADPPLAAGNRWIALVESSRLTTFEGIGGLADLQHAVALRIEAVGSGLPTGITVEAAGGQTYFSLAVHSPLKAPEPSVNVPSTSAGRLHEFEVPAALRDDVERQSMVPRGLDSRYISHLGEQGPAYNTFFELRDRLATESKAFFAHYTPPARPALSTLPENVAADAFFRAVHESGFAGLVLGEAHSALSCKDLLIEQMKGLKRRGFTTLYVEHLCSDLHQADLDAFLRTQKMSKRLEDYLWRQDRGHMPEYRGPNGYSGVYQTAAKYGLRIRALDCAVSYNLKGVSDRAARYRMFNYLAARTIKADQAAHGPHKWIAFIGNSHANYYRGVPGLADMLGGVSLNVRDVAAGQGRSVHRGIWETVEDRLGSTSTALRCDFNLDVGIAGKAAQTPLPAVDRGRLTEAGQFLIDRSTPSETRLIHRSRSGDTVSTPIQVDDTGMYFIDRWGKKQERFALLETLIGMLKHDVHLTPAP